METAQVRVLRGTIACSAISKGKQAVKRCSCKILQFLTGGCWLTPVVLYKCHVTPAILTRESDARQNRRCDTALMTVKESSSGSIY